MDQSGVIKDKVASACKLNINSMKRSSYFYNDAIQHNDCLNIQESFRCGSNFPMP